MPSGWEGPSHARLPDLLLNNLTAIPVGRRRELYSVVNRLYYLRLQADYMPSAHLREGEATSARGLMFRAIDLLKAR